MNAKQEKYYGYDAKQHLLLKNIRTGQTAKGWLGRV